MVGTQGGGLTVPRMPSAPLVEVPRERVTRSKWLVWRLLYRAWDWYAGLVLRMGGE